MDWRKKYLWISTGLTLFCFSALSYFTWVERKGIRAEHKKRQREIALLEKRFNKETAMVKEITSFTCSPSFIEVVFPQKGLEREPRLIIMGLVVGIDIPVNRLTSLEIKSNGEKVELWGPNKITHISLEKLAEKHDVVSKFCREWLEKKYPGNKGE